MHALGHLALRKSGGDIGHLAERRRDRPDDGERERDEHDTAHDDDEQQDARNRSLALQHLVEAPCHLLLRVGPERVDPAAERQILASHAFLGGADTLAALSRDQPRADVARPGVVASERLAEPLQLPGVERLVLATICDA